MARSAGIRAVAVVLGATAATLGAMVVNGSGGLDELQVGDYTVFPRTAIGEPGVAAPEGDDVERSIRIALGDDNSSWGSVTATVSIELDADDEFATATAAGAFRGAPWRFADDAAEWLTVDLDGARSGFPWLPPTAETVYPDRVRFTSTAELPVDQLPRPDELKVTFESVFCAETCPVTLTVSAQGWDVVSIDPAASTERRTAQEVEATVSRDPNGTFEEGSVEVALEPTGSADDTEPVPVTAPSGVTEWLRVLAVTFWSLLPWWFLRRQALRAGAVRPPQNGAVNRFAAAARQLLALGVVATLVISTSYADRLRWFWQDRGLDLYLGTASAAAVAFLALWAWQVRPTLPGPPAHDSIGGLTAVALGVTSVLVSSLRPGNADLALGLGRLPWLAIGCVLALYGLLILAVGSASGSGVRGALPATGVLLLVSVLAATFSPVSDWAAGLITAVCGAAAVAVAAWVVTTAVTPDRATEWRSRRWVRLAVVTLSLLAVVPGQRWGGDYPRWLTPYDAVSVGYLLQAGLRVFFVAIALGLMWSIGSTRRRGVVLERWVAVWLAAALLLRPDVVAGVAWSFLAGLLLVALVLLPADGYPTRALSPLPQQNQARNARSLVRARGRERLLRDLRRHTRAKVASGDIEVANAREVRQQVRRALDAADEGARDPDGLDTWSWAGEPSPWRRALWGGGAATVVGVVLLLATLARAVAEVPGLLGTHAWSAFFAMLLAFRFPLYGVIFGFLYPLVPGRTGLMKSLRLFAVVGVSEAVPLLVPLQGGLNGGALLLRLLQLAVICLVLGVGADLLTLRWAGVGAERLGDLYHASRVVVWTSGLAVATATTVATTLLGTAASVLIESLVPEPPPPATSSTDPSDGNRSRSDADTPDPQP